MTRETASRRGHTRWLMIAPLTGLLLIVLGVVALESAGTPTTDTADRVVDDLAPLDLPDARQCQRLVDSPTATEIRAAFEPGGRVSSIQVYRCPAAFDRLEVTYVGEVVGELIERRGGVWAQVNDDAYALETGPLTDHRDQSGFNTGLAVWLPDGLHERIGAVGGPDRRGDVIRIQGLFERTDPNDGEGTTIRAQQLEVVAPSLEVEDPFYLLQAVVAGLLATAAIVATVWARQVRRR